MHAQVSDLSFMRRVVLFRVWLPEGQGMTELAGIFVGINRILDQRFFGAAHVSVLEHGQR